MMEKTSLERREKASFWEENRAFFQATTVKGARYLDDTGKIINEYRDDYYDTSVGIDGLHFTTPRKDDLPDEITVDMNRLWIACYGEGCIRKVKENAEGITKIVSRCIEVESYSRLGFRTYYFKRLDNIDSYTQRLYSRIAQAELQTLLGLPDKILEISYRTRFLSPPFSVWFGVHPLVVRRPPERKGDFTGNGVIIDIDVSEDKDSSQRILNVKHLTMFLKESSDYIVRKTRETIEFLKGVEESGD